MKKTKLSLLAFAAFLFTFSSSAQTGRSNNWCFTDQQNAMLEAQNPDLSQQKSDVEKYVQKYMAEHKNDIQGKKAINYIIPVVFHVVTYDGLGYVSKNQIDQVMSTINEDFQRTNSDANQTRSQFLPYVADAQVEFRLAHLDPNGNCTEGIVRIESPLTIDAGNSVKSVSYWNSKKYLNIWVVSNIAGGGGGSIIAGYAQFPTSGINSTYGIVMDNNFINGSSRTLSHEIGHCFGLYHTFQGGCSSSGAFGGDGVTDTPPSNTNGFSCSTSINSCNNIPSGDPYGFDVEDQTENFMSYANCQNMFSLGQKSRMDAVLASNSTSTGLKQLSNGSNLIATGTATPYNPAICIPIADFEYNKTLICQGQSVLFTDFSYNASPTIWNWTFGGGGTPNTSPLENPTIVFNTPGVWSTTHEPGTTAGSALVTKPNIITVSSLTADYGGIIVDGFENSTNFNNDWIILDPTGGQAFQRTTAAAATGSASTRVVNYSEPDAGEIDELISPSYDLSLLSGATLKFKMAFAQRQSSNTDRLFVYYSLDCGESWSFVMAPMIGAGVSTIGTTLKPNFWTPISSDWAQKTASLSAITSETNVRFKFQFTSGNGNNFYLDDINIDGVLSINDEFDNIGSLSVYPNPTNSSAQISFNLKENVQNLSIKVRNAVGQIVTNVVEGQSFSVGKYTLKVDEQRRLSSGVYFIEFNADDNVKVKKLIVQ